MLLLRYFYVWIVILLIQLLEVESFSLWINYINYIELTGWIVCVCFIENNVKKHVRGK